MMESKNSESTSGAKSCREIGDWPVFPVEIFEDIIQLIALREKKDNKPTKIGYYFDDNDELALLEVQKLSLVCWMFTQLCRPHIWESINVSFESLKKLSDIVTRSPILATYIIRVSCLFESSFVEVDDVPGLSVLFGLPNVKEFEIPEGSAATLNYLPSYNGEKSKKYAWRAILSHFMARPLSKITISNMWDPPIVQLLSSPALKTLHLHHCKHKKSIWLPAETISPNGFGLKRFIGSYLEKFPLEILSCCPELEELDLLDVHPSDDDTTRAFLLSMPVTPFRRLRKFTTHGLFDCSLLTRLATVAGLKYFPALKVINIEAVNDRDIPGVVDFFKYCRSLEKIFFLIFQGAASVDPKPLHELILTSKETLSDIWLDFGVTSLKDAEHIVGEFCNTLERMHGQSVLEELTIGTHFPCMDSDLFQPPSVEQWQRLDKVLLNNDGEDFPHLREVLICLEPSVNVYPTGRVGQQPEAKLKSFFKEALKGLFATKRFRFMSAINLHMRYDQHDI